MSMPGKQARVLCPVCQEPIPPDETECENCGAFVIDEAVVRLSRAFGLDRDRALKLFEAGFRHPTQLRDRDPNRVLEKGEVGLLFICTNCGGFVAGGDSSCPRCAAEFETETEPSEPEEEDILDLVLCPVCGADNDPEIVECEICGEVLRESRKPTPAARVPAVSRLPKAPKPEPVLEKVDDFLKEPEHRRPEPTRPAVREVPVAQAPRPVPRTPPVPAVPRDISAVTPRLTPPRSIPSAPPPPSPKPGRPATLTASRPRPADPIATLSARAKAGPATPIRSSPARETTSEPTKPAVPPKVRKAASPNAISSARPNRLPRKKVRSSPAPFALTPQTVAGFVLAAGAGLLLAGALGQLLVSVGIVVLLLGLGGIGAVGLLRGVIPRPSRFDGILLAAAIAIGLGAPVLRSLPSIPATALAVGAAVPLAWLSRRLVRSPRRILVAIGSSAPVIGQGLMAALDPSYAMTVPWIVGILAAMPWPAALASMEILRRRSATVLRRQIVRAERGIERKDYERSLADYERAIAAAPEDVPGAEIPWYGKGATLILLGRYEEALHAIDKALDINPWNEVAWVNKGNAFTRMGQLLDALRCFNAAIKVNPIYEVAWNNKGNALARLRKYEEALRCYERALAIDPGYRGAWVNMGFVLTKLERFDEAASCADHALHLETRRRAEPA